MNDNSNKLNGIVVTEPIALRSLLATMKSAKAQRRGMAIWERDIKAIEDAIAVIEGIRHVYASLNSAKCEQ